MAYGSYRKSDAFLKSLKRTSDVFKDGMILTVRGSFKSTRFHNADNGFVIATMEVTSAKDENGFDIKPDPELVCKGTVPSYVEGALYVANGQIVDDKRYGIQLNMRSASQVLPSSSDEIAAFLVSCKIPKVGPATAQKIVDEFGDKSYNVITKDIGRLRDVKIKGVGQRTIERIIDEVPRHLTDVETVGFLAAHGLTSKMIQTVLNEYGAGAKDIIMDDPYVLTKLKGFAFTRADSIAMKLGFSMESPKRIRAGIVATLRWLCLNRGYTLVPEEVLFPIVYEKLGIEETRCRELVMRMTQELVKRGGKDGLMETPDGLQLPYLYEAEDKIKKSLKKMVDGKQKPLVNANRLEDAIIKEQDELGFQLTDDQLLVTRNVFVNNLTLLTGASGVGKALPMSEPIWRQNMVTKEPELVTMGDIKVGDHVYGSMGRPIRVIGVFPQGIRDVYEVRLHDGRIVRCSDEHLWTVMEKIDGENVEKTVTTKEMLERGTRIRNKRHAFGTARYRIPMCEPLDWTKRKHAINPYVIGYLIGDGVIKGNDIVLPKASDDEVWELSSLTGTTFTWHDDGWHVPATDEARGLLSGERHVPMEYRLGSIKQRLSLIQGLFDAKAKVTHDGHVTVRLTTTSETLSEDVREVLFSLGVRSTVSVCEPGNAHVLTYTIDVLSSSDMTPRLFRRDPFKTMVVREASRSKHDVTPFVPITDIVPSGSSEEMVCIAVASMDELFCVGRDFVLTHNTSAIKMVTQVATRLDVPFMLCSPTGKAAKRLSEACTPKGKPPIPTYTLHRALGIGMTSDDNTDMMADERQHSGSDSPANVEARKRFEKARIVLCDEVSMLDTPIAARLLEAVAKGHKHLLMIGDPNQLPSVGPGAILADFLSYEEIPQVRLTKIFRQAQGSPIIVAANEILQGRNPCHTPGIEFHECDDKDVLKVIDETVIPMIQKEGLTPADITFMSPMKKRTATSGVEALNAHLRPILNKTFVDQGEKGNRLLQRGDFVTQTKNNYEVDRFNGDQGIVTSTTLGKDGHVYVRFLDDISGNDVEYTTPESWDNLMLAYASTIHRYQGSQCPTVVLVMTDSHYVMCNRNLLYTGLTRAEKRVILIGNETAFKRAAKNKREMFRYTGLKHMQFDSQQELDLHVSVIDDE